MMHAKKRPRGWAAFPGLLAVWLVAAGCGDDGLGKRYPVSGNVTYKDKPVASGSISFVPKTPEGRAASGEIHDGNYTLTTQSPEDGALPGKYGVRIIAKEIDDSQVLANAKGGAANQMDVIKANNAAKRLIPAKYELAETSGLEAEVEEHSNTFDFTLTD